MSPSELATELEAALQRHAGKSDAMLCWTFVARSSRGLPVRPQILNHKGNGEKVYGITMKQARKLLALCR